METIRNNRAFATSLTCGSIPFVILLLGKLLDLIGTLLPSIKFILPIVSILLFLFPSILFFLALVVPNLDMLDRGYGPALISKFYKPVLKSIGYYAAAGWGLVITFYLIFIIPFFLYFAVLPVLAILFFYFRAVAKLAIKFLGRENSSYGNTFSYQQFAWCGLLAVAITFGLQMLVPIGTRRFIGGELLTCLGGMAGVGYMFGRVLQGQHDEEQFYLENYPEQALAEHKPIA